MTDPDNTAVYVILCLYLGVLVLATVFSYFVSNTTKTYSFGPFSFIGDKVGDLTKNYLGAGTGFGATVWFFTMCASLFSANSLSAVANEAHIRGFQVIRWICAGIPIYGCYLLLAPRLHALGKARGYLTPNEFFFDRFAVSSSPLVAHAIRVLSLLCCQLPIFTYLITQFTGIGTEIEAFTRGEISRLGALFTAAIILLILSTLGGLRGVAYTDVVQGLALLIGSLTLFCVQHSELGGMGAMSAYTRSEEFKALKPPFGMFASYNNVPKADGAWSTTSYSAFVIKITISGTMLPHLLQRLFMARDTTAIRKGMSAMPLMFFFIQLASCMVGWIAVREFAPEVLLQGVYGSLASAVRATGPAGQFGSALIISAAVCAMMSTADSALIAFGTMWLKDAFVPYVLPGASQQHQLYFAKAVGVFGLGIGLLLASMSLQQPDVWNLSSLFSIQAVTVIHIAPAMWLGLHWKGLRGEPVLAGMIVGLAITIGMTASPVTNSKLQFGVEEYENGWSLALIGLCFNLIITVLGGLLLDLYPNILPVCNELPKFARPLDIEKLFGEKYDKALNPGYWFVWVILFMFMTPFYRVDDFGMPDSFVEFLPTWAFVALLFSAFLTIWIAVGYYFLWQDYDLPNEPSLFPVHPKDQERLGAGEAVPEGKDMKEAPSGSSSDNQEALFYPTTAPTSPPIPTWGFPQQPPLYPQIRVPPAPYGHLSVGTPIPMPPQPNQMAHMPFSGW
mmetsp:Transcript_22660/g.55947  ORF Transcript_22660/g.55947 Transcript_22660/m.55947 type:complete len:732 (-) Transcript_22660:212-2407(-)|eukprot:CAMPEP_0206237948 /NCGR_PEP_ID=MMETSP0047_2-20121206/14547_1 /ASSEMBLY_ACC=CAM_ASM_000192 /TAXON_ID=195065 /ORGANISM="Chroomonas mesostigmatica_cf, Strain CCMP1168" /LENGTH=731 /DNA_ID=CAMNT_0053662437 /DNA_START=175 /DNA_END=2370 /DNA_ORIENTATION=+